MTRFESIGVDLQQNAETIQQAKRAFNYSCKLCCQRGLRLDCDSCAIYGAHRTQISFIKAMEEDAKESAQKQNPPKVHHVFLVQVPRCDWT